VQFSHAFGRLRSRPMSATPYASVAPGAVFLAGSSGYRNVSYINAGGGRELRRLRTRSSVNTGDFSAAPVDSGSPFGPLAKGAKKTTEFIIGVGYSAGPYSIGAQYYHVDYDALDGAGVGSLGDDATINGEALGAGYQVGPGVSVLPRRDHQPEQGRRHQGARQRLGHRHLLLLVSPRVRPSVLRGAGPGLAIGRAGLRRPPAAHPEDVSGGPVRG